MRDKSRRGCKSRRGFVLLAAVALAGVSLALPGTSSADVTAVEGSAFGVFASVSHFGGPPVVRGPVPSVTLPAGGSAVPVTATQPTTLVTFGPATLFSSGPVTVSTQGTPGPTGSVTSSVTIEAINTSQQEVFTAAGLSTTCTANEAGVSGSTMVTAGVLQTSEGNPDVEGDEVFVNIPVEPDPNTEYTGAVEAVGDSFRIVFNEQIVNPDGSLTVNGAHMYLLGPTAVGDHFIGQSVCGVTATGVTTTTSSTTTSTLPVTTTSSTTTSTLPVTTTSSSTTSTTIPSSTTTTVPEDVSCGGLTATIVGTPGPDRLFGTDGPDVISGLGGDDKIVGLDGDDVVCGGGGNDVIEVGAGHDTVSGGAGDDRIVGASGRDLLRGADGNDTIVGGSGNDRLHGGPGDDDCIGGSGTNTYASCEIQSLTDAAATSAAPTSPFSPAPTLRPAQL